MEKALKTKEKKQSPPYVEIITDLNSLLGSFYRINPVATDVKKLINARFADGYTFQDFQAVHRKMDKAWNNDPKMKPFLRPQTLYTGRFSSYLNWPDTENKPCPYDSNKPCYFDCTGCDYAKKETK